MQLFTKLFADQQAGPNSALGYVEQKMKHQCTAKDSSSEKQQKTKYNAVVIVFFNFSFFSMEYGAPKSYRLVMVGPVS
jgi:hypothetical protein